MHSFYALPCRMYIALVVRHRDIVQTADDLRKGIQMKPYENPIERMRMNSGEKKNGQKS